MGKSGRFSRGYDTTPIRRVLDSDEVQDEIRARAAAQVEPIIHDLALQVSLEHGIDVEGARLMVAQLMHETTEFVRWVKAGQARLHGLPHRALVEAMGYSSPTSVARRVDTIDAVATAQAKANTTRLPVKVDDEFGNSVILQPGDGPGVDLAVKRGWMSPDDDALAA